MMILKNKKLNRKIDIDFNTFRNEYADEIQSVFIKYRIKQLENLQQSIKDDFSLEYNFYIEFQKNFNDYSDIYKIEF